MYRAVSLLWVGALTISLMSSMQALAQDQDSPGSGGAVFVMTNSVEKNEVIAYRRAADGTLREQGKFAVTTILWNLKARSPSVKITRCCSQ
jgi:hypothetical protein